MRSLRKIENRLRAVQGFTLVELLAVIAILSILAAVALPAYNNYTVKSKFSEVVMASNPTKAAIETCVGSGYCVSGGAINIAVASGPATPTAAQINAMIAMWGIAAAINGPSTASQEAYSYVMAGDAIYAGYQGVCAAYGSANNCLVSSTGQVLNVVANSTIDYYQAWQQPSNAALSAQYASIASSQGAGSGVVAANLPCIGSSSPTNCTPPTKYVASVSYDQNGLIYATAVSASSGLNGEQYVLVPSYSGGRVDWMASGSCKTRQGGALC